jgi:hypothetical protein
MEKNKQVVAMTLRLTPHTHRLCRHIAADMGKNLSEAIGDLIAAAIMSYEFKDWTTITSTRLPCPKCQEVEKDSSEVFCAVCGRDQRI